MKLQILLGLLLLINQYTFAQKVGNGKVENFVLAEVHNLYSETLLTDRKLNIYLPANYNAAVAYPVIYLLDGSADEDFIHVAGILQHNNFPWVNRTEPSILVGIANTNRKKDFTSPSTVAADLELIPNNGGSQQFITFLEQELHPYIASKFKVNAEKTLIGQSLAGLLALEVLNTKPRLFDNYMIISPSLWWRDEYMLQDNFNWNIKLKKNTNLYLAVGTEGKMYTGVRSMEESAAFLANKLKGLNIPNLHIYFEQLTAENHATVGHQAILNGFKFLEKK